MWEWLERWGPVIRDVLSVGIAALGAYLAWRSIKMGREQDKVTEKQMLIMEGQKSLLEELGNLAKRQTEIAESQHELMQRDLSRTVELEMVCWNSSSGWADENTHEFAYTLEIRNVGTKATREIVWTVRVSKLFTGVKLRCLPGNNLLSNDEAWEVQNEDDLEPFWEATGRHDGPIYADQLVPCVVIEQRLQHPITEAKVDKCFVRLECGEGRFPGSGVTEMKLSTT